MSILGNLLDLVFKAERGRPVVLDGAARQRNRQAWSRLESSRPAQGRTLVVTRIEPEAADVVSLYLEPAEAEPLSFQAGQFLTCCFQIDGQLQRRAYSISSLPDAPWLRITVKRLPEGLVSSYVQRDLQVGDRFQALGPSGQFVLPERVDAALFVAGGSGITPIRPLIEDLLRRSPQTPVRLLYGCRGPEDIIFKRELEDLAECFPSLKIRWVLSQPGADWQGDSGRIDAAMLREVWSELEPHEQRCAFVCGPEGLLAMTQETFAQWGEQGRLRHERFLAAPRTPSRQSDRPQPIYFRASDRQVLAQPGQTLLEAALAAGLELPYSCQVGGCGHCRVRVRSGEVYSDEPNCLTEQEMAEGYRLACLSHACSPVEVDA